MYSIKILDKDINLLGVINEYESFNLTRRFFKYGEFELKISANKNHTDKLLKNNLLLLNNSYDKVCIILHREFTYQSGGENTDLLLVKGITLKGLLKRRLIVPSLNSDFEKCEGKEESIMKYFVDKNAINPEDKNRKISNLILAKDSQRGKDDRWRSSYDNLAEKLEEIGTFSNLGWNISLDHKNKKFLFDVLEGKDLTVNQKENPPVIFRNDFNNISTRHFIESIINSSNIAYTGTKEDSSKMVLQIGSSKDFERIETFVDLSSEDSDELQKAGESKLLDLRELKSFELEINPFKTFIYEKDYNLGDIVTIQDKKLKVTMNSRIVEVKESYGKEGMKIKVTFGSSIPTLLTTIKRMVK